jgi:MFS family permease
VLAVLLAGPFLAVLDGFVVIVAVPSIQDRLHATNAGVQLVVAAYATAYAALLVTGGRLGDIFGRRRLLLIGLGLFSAASLGAASAPNQEVLIAARTVQGGAAALMYPQALALIRINFRGRELALAMAWFGVVLGATAVVAQLIAGILVQADVAGLGWRPIFVVGLPVSVAAAVAVAVVPESRASGSRHVDLAGVALMTICVGALVYPLTVGREDGWPLWTWAGLAGALAAGALLVARERNIGRAAGKRPLLDLDLFRIPAFTLGLWLTIVFYGGQLSFWILLTLYLQRGLELEPLMAGMVGAPVALGFLCASVAAPRLLPSAGPRILAPGSLALAGCTGLLSAVAVTAGGRDAAIVEMVPVLFACGLGYGSVIPTLVGAVLRAMPAGLEGTASGVLITAQQVAGALGVALSGVLLFGLLQRAEPYSMSFAIAAGFNVVLFAAAGVLGLQLRGAR